MRAKSIRCADSRTPKTLMNANFEYLCYGLMAAWLIVAIYVILLGLRESKLRKELDRVRQMVEPRGK